MFAAVLPLSRFLFRDFPVFAIFRPVFFFFENWDFLVQKLGFGPQTGITEALVPGVDTTLLPCLVGKEGGFSLVLVHG